VRKKVFGDLPNTALVLTAVSFLVAVGFGLIIPAIPVFAKSFGVTNTAIGLVVSMFALMRFSAGLFSGKVVNLFGERMVLGVGLFLVAFFILLTGFAQSYLQLLIFRTLSGLGSSMFSVSASSLLLRSVNPNQRAQAQSIYNGGFLVGGVAGPAVGGLLAGINPRAPFFVYATSLSMASFVAFFFLTEKRIGSHVADSLPNQIQTSIRQALAMYPYRVILFLIFVFNWVLFGIRSSILPLFVTDKLGSSIAIAGLGITVGALVQGIFLIPAGKYSDKNGRKPALINGGMFILIGLLLLIFSSNLITYFISMVLMGFGSAYASAAPMSIVGDLISGRGGQVIAVAQMAGDAGMIAGPLILGFITDHSGFTPAFAVSTFLFLASYLLIFTIQETHTRQKTVTKSEPEL